MVELNRVELSGTLSALGALRHTPAGVPVLEFCLRHESECVEAGAKRKVSAECDAIAFESLARLLASTPLGRRVRVTGFLAAKSRRSRKLVVHVNEIEFLQGD